MLLEDHPVVREAIAGLLEAAGLPVVGQFGDPEAFLQALPTLPVDVALVDLALQRADCQSGMDGLAVLEVLRQRFPAVRSLVLSASVTPLLVDKALRAGARGFLPKLTADSQNLVTAIRAVARGEALAPPELPASTATLTQEALTPREAEVLAHIAVGEDNLKIAALLGITERTVRAHVTSIYRKLGTENRTQLALLARELGIVLPTR